MSKIEQAAYIANLIVIMQARVNVGGDPDGVIMAEYQRACVEFMEMLDEAGNGEQHASGSEEGADLA